jgi:hypothetical protein
MLRSTVPLALLLLAAAPAAAQTDPDEFLSARTQVYLRWEGAAAHHDAYQKTALGRMMQGDLGRLCDALTGQLKDIPVPPDQRETVDALKRLGSAVLQNGFVAGVEVFGVSPPDARLTVVLPKAGGELASVQKLIAAAAARDKSVKVEEQTVAGKKVQSVAFPGGHFFTFAADGHAVAVVGTADPAQYFAAKKPEPIGRSELYKAVRGDAGFPTTSYGFIDVGALLGLAREAAPPEVGGVLDTLGLNGLKAVRYRSGYDGRALRSQVEVQTQGERKGALRLLGGKPMTLADLPPLPADLLRFQAGSVDFMGLHDTVVRLVEDLAKLDPKDGGRVQDALKQIDQVLGVSLRDDILGELAGPVVTYTSPGENFILSGLVLAFRVKDGDKLRRSLGAAITNLGKKNNAPVTVVERRYRDATFHEVSVPVPGYFVAPTYAVSKGWLVVALYPQPVQGFVLRQGGQLPAWKPGPGLEPSLERLPRQFTGLSVSDPRPAVRSLLALLPPIAAAARSAVPELQGFDVGLIPNGHEATRPLFPNVTVTTDDGTVLRVDSLESVSLPFPLDLVGDSPGAGLVMLGALSWVGRSSAWQFERAAPKIEPQPRPGDFPRPAPAPKPPAPEKPPR